MVGIDRFFACDTEKPELIQPGCPVYLHCFRRNVERITEAQYLQVRLVNRSDYRVESVFLRVEGYAADGTAAYVLPELLLTKCAAAPHSVFGEDRLLALAQKPVKTLRIIVERVAFSDGMMWRRLGSQGFLPAEQWPQCPTCAMRNPPEQERCALCGGSLCQSADASKQPPVRAEQLPQQILAPECALPPERPAPIVRTQPFPLPTPDEESEETDSVPAWLVVLLCVLGTAALFVLAALVVCFLQRIF